MFVLFVATKGPQAETHLRCHLSVYASASPRTTIGEVGELLMELLLLARIEVHCATYRFTTYPYKQNGSYPISRLALEGEQQN